MSNREKDPIESPVIFKDEETLLQWFNTRTKMIDRAERRRGHSQFQMWVLIAFVLVAIYVIL